MFPAESDLRTYASDERLDASNPQTRHLLDRERDTMTAGAREAT